MPKRAHSTLDDPEVKSLVQAMLAAGKTYDEIGVAVLQQTGTCITRSAISRGKLRWESAAAQLEAAKREAATIQAVMLVHPEQDLGEAAMGLMLSKLMQRFANVQEGFDGADLLDLGNLLVKTARTGQMKEALVIQRERLELIKQRAREAADQVKADMSEAGVAGDKIAAAVDRILGVTA